MTGAVGRASRGQWTDDEIRCQAAATPDAAHGVTADVLPNDGKQDIRNVTGCRTSAKSAARLWLATGGVVPAANCRASVPCTR